MVTTYHSRPSRSNSNAINHQPSILQRVISLLPFELAAQTHSVLNRYIYNKIPTQKLPRSLQQAQRNWNVRRVLNLPHLFIAVWVIALFWGERWVFQRSVEDCKWENWERWPKDAAPHHLVFLADPQLIDPHSYPDRPWPLSTLTMMHTDNYLRRSYITLQKKIHPDTLFFLGDLFDGGREWKTAHGNTEDPAWANGQRPHGEQIHVANWGKRYGQDFWLKEYDRFGKIFYKYWNTAGSSPGQWQRGRRIISSLPGNHDLGFGANVKIPIRDRFEVYFGEGNRVDVIGNHTFVSVDAVSLSAGGTPQDTTEITRPIEEFLKNIQSTKRKAVARELRFQAGNTTTIQHAHKVEDLSKANFKNLPTLDPGKGNGAELPTVLLTHVPLYRPPGTPCGRKRERSPPIVPPKGRRVPISPDEGNAISISRGWQYQNVLSESDSVALINKIGYVKRVFSGDDHDYCELVHREDKENVKEITVKAMSWAMGVRKPGFLLMTMWNPLSPTGESLSTETETMKTHLCLLPDQIGILIRYGILIAFTILTLVIRAILTPYYNLVPFSPSSQSSTTSIPLLPTTNFTPTTTSQGRARSNSTLHHNSSTNFHNTTSRSRYNPPQSSSASTSTSPDWREEEEAEKKAINPGWKARKRDNAPGGAGRRKMGRMHVIWRESWMSVWRTTWVVVLVYFWLCWFL